MERNYHAPANISVDPDELNWRSAFHEAGHASAIHIGNKKKRLPPVYFEIVIKKPKYAHDHFFAKVVEGNLIQNLPIAMMESFSSLSGCVQQSCQHAYEADVINLLVGPLAEAKYVACRDNQIFKFEFIKPEALHHYGGYSDLETVQSYLDSFIAAKELREEKLMELMAQAFNFIDNKRNWRCILNLARHILNCGQETISCDEAIDIMDNSLAVRKWTPAVLKF
ncbi:MAG: hypothetical protein ABSB19_07950 [Methylomonas sp.]